MIAHKHITKIIAAGMAAAVCLCLCTVAFSGPIAAAAGETGVSMAHNYYLYEAGGKLNLIPWIITSPSAAWGTAMTLPVL